MKRYRIVSKFRFTAFLTAAILLTVIVTGSFFGFFDAASMDEQNLVKVQVQFGDTLWALAKEYGPSDVDCRQVVYEICTLNNISANTLQAGQNIYIPTSL